MVIAVVHSDSKLGGEYKGKRQGINVCIMYAPLFYCFTILLQTTLIIIS